MQAMTLNQKADRSCFSPILWKGSGNFGTITWYSCPSVTDLFDVSIACLNDTDMLEGGGLPKTARKERPNHGRRDEFRNEEAYGSRPMFLFVLKPSK